MRAVYGVQIEPGVSLHSQEAFQGVTPFSASLPWHWLQRGGQMDPADKMRREGEWTDGWHDEASRAKHLENRRIVRLGDR